MDDWTPDPYDDEDDAPSDDDVAVLTERDRFSEAVGDAWEAGLQRDVLWEPDGRN